ncbi:hypothetical protein [Peptoniphilus catoniae]|uniref:hypothetical protein n=1 Tax=Peptoniphilus catoniae TaxID=1660341 RepID=UPI0010FE702F|nr:hypothetical protein [Peptoniphilus catoniae]
MRYFKIDLKRALKRRSTLGTFLVFSLIVLACHLGIIFANKNALNSINEGYNYLIITFASLQIVIASSSWLSAGLSTLNLSDEEKEGGYKRPIEAGISRENIIISKFLGAVTLCLIFAIFMLTVHFICSKIIYGFIDYKFILIKIFLKYMGLMILPICAIISVIHLVFLNMKNESLATILGLSLNLVVPGILLKLNNFLNIGKIEKLMNLMPIKTAEKISGKFFKEVIYKLSSSEEAMNSLLGGIGKNINLSNIGPTDYSNLIPGLVVSVIILVMAIGLNLIIFKRRNID